ncbi:BQ2448_7021 [Microbotryum intermedium]|uniref:BQ2448_7021 protein n=1 Tax=Microbotryum intermedium TaxID=269621 RepID=A0A238FPS5_9BASI|nr:BQ2448_7021 [Microbotryum intermedium]
MSHFNVAMAVLIGLGVVVVGSFLLCSVMFVTTRRQSAMDRRLTAVESGLSVQGHLSSDVLSGPAPYHPPPSVSNMAAPDLDSLAIPYRLPETEHRFRPQLPSEYLFARSQLYPSSSSPLSVPFQRCIPIPPSYDPNRRRLPSYEDVMGVSAPAVVVIETVVTTRRSAVVGDLNEMTRTRRTMLEHDGEPRRNSGELSTDDYGHATDDDTESMKSAGADAAPGSTTACGTRSEI